MASGGWCNKWDVVGSKGTPYVVAQKEDGTFGCSCPGWKFKKAPKPDCRHIRSMKQALNAMRGVSSVGTPPRDYRYGRVDQEVSVPVRQAPVVETPVKVVVDDETFLVSRRKFRD